MSKSGCKFWLGIWSTLPRSYLERHPWTGFVLFHSFCYEIRLRRPLNKRTDKSKELLLNIAGGTEWIEISHSENGYKFSCVIFVRKSHIIRVSDIINCQYLSDEKLLLHAPLCKSFYFKKIIYSKSFIIILIFLINTYVNSLHSPLKRYVGK